MTLNELESLRPGEVVVFTKIDKSVNTYNKYDLGDELIFSEIQSFQGVINFIRIVKDEYRISYFTYDISNYIERKVILERDRKLNDILI